MCPRVKPWFETFPFTKVYYFFFYNHSLLWCCSWAVLSEFLAAYNGNICLEKNYGSALTKRLPVLQKINRIWEWLNRAVRSLDWISTQEGKPANLNLKIPTILYIFQLDLYIFLHGKTSFLTGHWMHPIVGNCASYVFFCNIDGLNWLEICYLEIFVRVTNSPI